MMRRIAACAAALAVCGWFPRLATADEAAWAIAGREVMRLYGSFGKMTPAKRAEMLDERVTNILSKGDGTLGAADIVLRRDRGHLCITVRGDLLVTVTPADAEGNAMSRDELGQLWLSNLRKTLPLLAPRVNKGGA